MKRFLSLLPILLASLIGSAQTDFETGLRAYESGDYSDAIQAFEKSLENGESGALRHNLALAHFQSGQLTEAVWQMERALQLAPHKGDYHFKLAALRQQLGLSSGAPDWLDAFSRAMSQRSWIILAAIAFWLMLASILLPLFAGKQRQLWGKTLLLLSSFGLLICGSALFLNRDLARRGICLNESPTELHAAPAAAAPQTGLARPGERALALERHNDYIKLRTEGGAEGWIDAESFRLIQ